VALNHKSGNTLNATGSKEAVRTEHTRGIDTEAWQCHSCVVIEPTERSSLYKAVERLLSEDLGTLVTSRRQYQYPWAAIAREVSDKSGVEVSDESLRRWFDTDTAERTAA